jgi:DNA-binding transcriptional regulator YbjK
MTPPRNTQRRQALADAAIDILGTRGIHELSHRAVDEAAGLPVGTASNYFKSRDDLLQAVARRIVDLHLADMDDTASAMPGEGIAELIGRSLYEAATVRRTRCLAIYQLSLEATRQPVLMQAMAAIAMATLEATVAHHRMLGLQTSPEQVEGLMTLFGGALFTLVTAPPEMVTPEGANMLARCIVTGVLQETPSTHHDHEDLCGL